MAMRDADFSGLLFGCARPKTALSSNGANDAGRNPDEFIRFYFRFCLVGVA